MPTKTTRPKRKIARGRTGGRAEAAPPSVRSKAKAAGSRLIRKVKGMGRRKLTAAAATAVGLAALGVGALARGRRKARRKGFRILK